MSRSREARVNDALSQLVDRIVPSDPEEDEGQADERFEGLFEQARATLDRQSSPSVNPDVGHIGDLIRQRLENENKDVDTVTRFGNLYSRLLSQPVLSQKWAILYFLYRLHEPDYIKDADSAVSPNLPVDPLSSFRGVPLAKSPAPSTVPSTRPAQRQNHVFDEAFSRPGLRSLPSSDQQREKLARLPIPQRPHANHMTNGKSGGTVVNGHSFSHDDPTAPLSEATLLRDIPFLLQGVSSTHLIFNSTSKITLPATIPTPMVSLLNTLAEPALLYKNISGFLESSEGGLVGQSLRAALETEIRSYLSLVATLEGQIRRALQVAEEQPNDRKSLGTSGVTLKRCILWMREPTLGLRLLNLIVEESRLRKGGQIISLIHSFASAHGDPFVVSFAERLLTHVTRPFYDMLRLWIYDGELSDPYYEFFVLEGRDDNDEDNGKGGATSVWEDKYKLDVEMIPSIMTEELARKIFLIGKSLNFIRYGCGDSVWVENYSKEASRELRYGDTASLSSSIDEAYRSTMARLIQLMNERFKLMEHLNALKKYLLLSQGDFISLLMESLAPSLDRPANSQYRHTLTAQLEHAIRNSNAEHDSADVLRRLDARMLERSHGDLGWDCFTLEYKIDAPVDVVVTGDCSRQYLAIFNFLWRIKRVEYALGSTWRRSLTGARGVLRTVNDTVGKDWKAARCAMAEMIHFISQLQYYILFEVVEASWNRLLKTFSQPNCTLDDLIEAHAKYLKSIAHKGLLSRSHYDFPGQLHEILKVILAYRDAVEGLYSYSLAEATRRQTGHMQKDKPRSRDADSPVPLLLLGAGNGADDSGVLVALRHRIAQLSREFQQWISGLLGDLAHQPDMDMRFLGVVMNYNDFYRVVRRSKRSKTPVEDDKQQRDKGKRKPASGQEREGSQVQSVSSKARSNDAANNGKGKG